MNNQYIDPINGNDSNDGLTEANPVKTVEKAFLNCGYVIDGDYYSRSGGNGLDDVDYFYLMRGNNLLTKGVKLTGANYAMSIAIKGKNGAILKYVGPNYLFWAHTISGIYFSLYNLHLINDGTFDTMLHNYAGGDVRAIAHNSTLKGFTDLGSSSATVTTLVSVTYDATSFGATHTETYCTDQFTTAPAGYLKATQAETIAGNGAFLPQPGGDYDYLPRNVIDFVTQGWVDDTDYTDGRPIISDSYISIDTGDSCRVLGPVLEYEDGIDFTTHYLDSVENDTLGAGSNEVIDSTPADATRTIEVRAALAPFLQTDASPSWVTIEKLATHANIEGKYVQFRVTLTSIGA